MNRIKEVIKKQGFFGIFPWLWLVFAYLWQLRFQIFYGRAILDSDLAGEMVLANLLNKEHSIISKEWFYSTELRVFESQWFYRLGLLISPNNWHVARVIATMLMLAIFAALVIIAARMLGLGKWGIWAAAILLCPCGRFWFVYSLYGTYYLIYSFFSLMTVIGIAGIVKSRKAISPKNVGFYVLGSFAGLASGLNGIKQFILFFAPLLIATFIMLIVSAFEKRDSIKSEKDIIAVCGKEVRIFVSALVFSCFNLLGFLINSHVLKNHYSFSEFGMTTWSSEGKDRLYNLFIDYVSLFGYEKGFKVLSVKGLLSGVGLIFGFLAVAVLIYLGGRFKKLGLAERFILLINVCTLGFCSVVFCFIELYQNYYWLYQEYYWLPLRTFAVFAILIAIRFAVRESGLQLKILPIVCAVLAAGLVTAVSKNTLLNAVENPQVHCGYEEAADFLVENGLTKGYAMLWSSNVLRELSSGKIETWNIASPDAYVLHKWLQEKSHLDTMPEGKVFFIMSSDPYQLGEAYKDSLFIQGDNCEEVFNKDNIHIYVFDSAESFRSSGMEL